MNAPDVEIGGVGVVDRHVQFSCAGTSTRVQALGAGEVYVNGKRLTAPATLEQVRRCRAVFACL